ncbi:MAG TPA: methyltransferase domain-containing protein [Ramlibacter sp.]|jgi:SAM-dependent methyltransferase|nr:methyltransferase domain-containing protein [Ramlibacter sp.]
MNCNVCQAAMGAPLHASASEQGLTSLCELREARTRVWLCPQCAHLRGEELQDVEQYYESEYRILLDQDDEDQIYDTQGDRIVYRTDHQVSTLLAKLQLPQDARFLDYGCAKASTPQRLLATRPDLQVHLFDVSRMYQQYWNRFVAPQRQAVHETPADWAGRFDVVTSFFSLEHIVQPARTAAHIASLLKPDGVLYGIVPDTFGNVADFVVVDHVNHFTAPSLHRLLADAGFRAIDIDNQAHRGALVFRASRAGGPTPAPDAAPVKAAAQKLARYWDGMGHRIRAAESASGDAPAAIYGSGFYGAFIVSALAQPARLRCVLDRSPFRHGKRLFDLPIVAPEACDPAVRTLYVGLNPAIARAAMAQMPWVQERGIRLVFLDEGAA